MNDHVKKSGPTERMSPEAIVRATAFLAKASCTARVELCVDAGFTTC